MTGIAKKDLLMKRKHLEIGLFSKFSSIQIQAVFVISILLLLISSVIYIFFEDYCVNEYRDSNFYYNQLSMNDATESLESWVQTKEESMKKLFQNSVMNHFIASGQKYQDSQAISAATLLNHWAEEENGTEAAFLWIKDSGLVVQSDRSMVPLESCELDSFFSSLEEMENDNGVVVRQGEHFVLYEGFPAARPLAVLVVILSPEMFLQSVQEKWPGDSEWQLYLYDGAGDPLFPEIAEYPELSSRKLFVEKVTDKYTCYSLQADSSVLVMQKYSDVLDWYLVAEAANRDIVPRGAGILQAVLPCIVFVLIFITAAAILLMIKVCVPIRSVVKILKKDTKNPSLNEEAVGNELRYIRGEVEKNAREREQLYQLVEEAEPEIAGHLLEKLVRTPEEACAETVTALNSMNLAYSGDARWMLLLYRSQEKSEDIDRYTEAYHGYETRQKVSDFWKARCKIQVLSFENQIQGIVLCYSDSETAAQIKREFSLFENEMERFSIEKGYHVAWGKGGFASSVSGLAGEFAEAEKAMNRRLYYQGSEGSEQSTNFANSEGVHYRSQLSRFIERMILGHVGAEQEIQALKCELEKKDESDILAVYPLIFDCGVEKLLTLQEDVSEIQALYHPTQVTGENAKEQIRSFLEQLVRQLQYSSYKEQYRYVEGAKRYIQEHYDNSMISLDTLSSYLGISSSYLSTLLSRFLSMGFTEYLNRFRLEQAKQLLEITSISVSEIGLKTGFNSVQNFDRVFKKYMGETPRKYRERMKRGGT